MLKFTGRFSANPVAMIVSHNYLTPAEMAAVLAYRWIRDGWNPEEAGKYNKADVEAELRLALANRGSSARWHIHNVHFTGSPSDAADVPAIAVWAAEQISRNWPEFAPQVTAWAQTFVPAPADTDPNDEASR
jgi:hypothetical protein